MKALFLVAAFSAVVWAQDSGLRAREMFYALPPVAAPVKKPAKKTPAPVVDTASVPLGLRYSIMKRDPDGKFIEVDQDATFHLGDQIRLDVDTNSAGYLYVMMHESTGNWSLLFPSPDVDRGNHRIDKGVSQQIPLGFDEKPGTEKLFLVLSRKPDADLGVASPKIGDDVVSRLRAEVKSLGLVIEKVDEMSLKYDGTNDVKTEKATYVVNPSRGDDARLAVDVALKRK
jgi:hypothetical protein